MSGATVTWSMGINETIVHAVLHDFAYAHSDQNKARFAKATSGMHIATELAKAPHGATMAKNKNKQGRARIRRVCVLNL